MAPEEVRDTLRQQPFEPFRLVMADGQGYEIRHPDLLWIGKRAAMVGLTGEPGQDLWERSVKIDLFHVLRLNPLEVRPQSRSNGDTQS
jgi:hypothetical protein